MIAYLKGKVIKKKENFLIIENQGVGYKVFVGSEVVLQAKEGGVMEFYIYQHVREDTLSLFGFPEYSQLELFELLISISGVGPKTALGVFALASVEDVKSAILNEDATILKKVSGIGAKTAERIVLELKNKVSGDFGEIKSKDELTAGSDAIEALVSLGYPANQAREALKKVDKSITDTGQKVKEALKLINAK